MIRIARDRVHRTASPADYAAARARFERNAYLKVSGLLDGAFLAELIDAVDRAALSERVHPGIGVELCLPACALTTALELVSNDRELFDLIDELTGCGPFGCFDGRVYQLVPGEGHYDSWHGDVGQDRRVAMSVNVGRQSFDGGVLQIRDVGTPDMVREVSNPSPGDGVIFRIDPRYEHRVSPIDGAVARTAYAGWFCTSPDFQALFAARVRS
jgi:hypothetical protein